MKTCSYDIVLAIILWIDLDLRILHLVILGYDVNEDLILNLRASLLRDNDSAVMIVRNDDRTCTTTLQQLLWVSEVSDERDRTGSSIDDTTHLDYLTQVIIDRTVCQLQLNSWERCDGCLNTTVGLRHAQDLRLREREEYLHSADIGNGSKSLTRSTYQSTYLERKTTYYTSRRTGNGTPSQLLAG